MELADIKNVTVAGGGTQGSQIASQIASKGFHVTVWLRSEASIDRAKPRFASIKQQYLQTIDAMKTDPSAYCRGITTESHLTDEQIDELHRTVEKRLDSIVFDTNMVTAFADADVVVECINEVPDQKQAFYEAAASKLPERTILLTDSSTMMPSRFAEATGRPDKYLTLHFANQIWRNNLAEVMKQDKTDPAAFELVAQFAESIGMVPLRLNKEWPGYILNTLLIPWFKAALTLAAEGVSDPATIDQTWVLDTGADPGQTPFRKLDKIGLPLAYTIFKNDPRASQEGTAEYKIAQYLKGYIDAGKTGIAVGEGFYKYE